MRTPRPPPPHTNKPRLRVRHARCGKTHTVSWMTFNTTTMHRLSPMRSPSDGAPGRRVSRHPSLCANPLREALERTACKICEKQPLKVSALSCPLKGENCEVSCAPKRNQKLSLQLVIFNGAFPRLFRWLCRQTLTAAAADPHQPHLCLETVDLLLTSLRKQVLN